MGEINDLEQNIDKVRSLIDSNKSHLEKDYTATKTFDEIKDMFRDFENKKGNLEDDYNKMDEKILSKKMQIGRFNDKVQELRERRGKSSIQRENLENLLK